MAIIQIVDVIEALVAKLDFTIEITSNTDNGGGNHILEMVNTYYNTKRNTVTIGGNDYTITAVNFNKSITVEPINHTIPITVTSFVLPAPTYFHGTVISTDIEITRTKTKKYPLVYLNELIKETNIADRTSAIKKNSKVTIFFLDIASYTKNLNKDFLNDVIKPLSNVLEKFIDIVKKEKGIGKITVDWDTTNIPRFARQDINGETKSIFGEELSGIELIITLPLVNC